MVLPSPALYHQRAIGAKCDNDDMKFAEACRLVELFIAEALTHG